MAPFWAACSLFLPMLLFGLLSGPVREPQGVGSSPEVNVIAVASAGLLSR